MLDKALWHEGFRYKLNYKKIPGSLDMAITKNKIAIFVDGEFWHGQDWGNRKQKLKSNREYWIEKIEENITCDKRNNQLLIDAEWLPLHFWEKEVKRATAKCASRIVEIIASTQPNR
jgi:DNA mismatch endonuclease (patch repair protein)